MNIISTSSTRTASPVPQDGTYHRDIALPAGAARLFAGVFRLELSHHAIHAAAEDKYGMPKLNRTLTVKEADVVEVTFFNSRPVKATIRVPYTKELDLVFVVFTPVEISPLPTLLAKTAWLNRTDDTHKTLDRSKFQVTT